ncbi:unnamed protein product [Prunus armeniaca]
MGIEVADYSNVEVPSSLQSICRYVETTLKPHEKIMIFTIGKEVFGADRSTFVLPEDITQLAGMEEIGAIVLAVYMRCLYDHLKVANMLNVVGFIDPAQPSLGLADCESKEGNRLFSGSSAWKSCGTPKQPSNVECRYYVMHFMRDTNMDPSLEFEKTFAKGKEQAPYPQATIDEVRNEWAEFVCLHVD